MPSLLPQTTPLRVVLLTLALAVAWPASAEIYRWVDSKGVTHYSDRIEEVPPEHRQPLEMRGGEGPTFAIVPGIGGSRREEGEAVAPIDEAAFEAEALAALERMRAEGGRPRIRDMLGQIPRGAWLKFGILMGLGALVVLSFAALFLKLACRICGEEPLRFPKALGIATLHLLATSAIGVLLLLHAPEAAAQASAQGTQLGLSAGVYAGLVRGLHSDSLPVSVGIAVVALLITMAVTVGLVLLMLCGGLGLSAAL